MAYRCDKCRTEYSSGSHYGGHDYCMACYTQLKQQDEHKRREAELKIQQHAQERRLLERRQMEKDAQDRKDARNSMLSDEYRKLDMKVVDWREEEIKRQRELRQARMQKLYDEQDRKRREQAAAGGPQRPSSWGASGLAAGKPRDGAAKKGAEDDAYATHLPGGRRHMPTPRPAEEPPAAASHQEGFGSQEKTPAEDILQLRVQTGLPVSLSAGQRGVMVSLSGKNISEKMVVAELRASAVDSKKNQLRARAEPSSCSIEPWGERQFRVKFDLKEETPKGPLSFSAYLSENAIYVDRETAKSPSVLLSSQVKTPMSLAYRKGSAKVGRSKEGTETISLAFDNLGESGGLLSINSHIKYGGKGAVAHLEKPTKVKGLHKNLLLCFAPAPDASIDRITAMLFGVDANGKAYQEMKTAGEKKKRIARSSRQKSEPNGATPWIS